MSEASRARVGGARTDRAALLPACVPRFRPRARFTRLKITRESASVVLEQATGTAGARTTPSRHRRVAIRRIEPNFHANFARRDAVARAPRRGVDGRTRLRRESENVFEVCPAGGRHMPTPVWTRACACRNLRDPVCNFEKMVYARSPDPDPSMRVCHMASDRRHMYSQGPCFCAILSLTQLPSATAEPLHQARLPRSPSRSAVAGEPAAEPRAHPCTTGISLGEGRSAESNYVQLCPIMSSGLLGAIELLELGEALGIVLVLELIKDRALLVLALDQEHLWVDSSDLDGAIKGDPGRSKEIIPAGPQSRP